jgi:hypothetical protein
LAAVTQHDVHNTVYCDTRFKYAWYGQVLTDAALCLLWRAPGSWELVTINPGIVFGPVAAPKLAESASVWQPIVEHMNGTK